MMPFREEATLTGSTMLYTLVRLWTDYEAVLLGSPTWYRGTNRTEAICLVRSGSGTWVSLPRSEFRPDWLRRSSNDVGMYGVLRVCSFVHQSGLRLSQPVIELPLIGMSRR
jgi:hypothetical protein